MFVIDSNDVVVQEQQTLLDGLANSVLAVPTKPVFRCGNESLSYREFDSVTNQLANMLIGLGVVSGDRIAICMPRSLDSAVATYAVLKAGAVYVPLDPAAPDAVLIPALSSCEVSILVSHPSLRRRWQTLSDTHSLSLGLRIIGDIRQASSYSANAPTVTVTADSLAYIIHTSGSTGTPKGIVHTHASALRFAELMVASCELNADDVIACHAPLHTDMSTPGLLVAPIIEATAEIIPEAHTRVPASLAKLIASSRITVWYSVPLALVQLLHVGTLKDQQLDALRWVIYAGEALAPRHLRSLMQLLPWAQFMNMYGPAETNVCTCYLIPPEAGCSNLLHTIESVPIGRVWGENDACVVDENGELVAPGEAGELLIHSPTMMSGYWKRPELDAKVFVNMPTSSGNKRFYRTGDIVRECATDGFRLVGRKDRQIKSRGFRVELDHIETTVGEMAEVVEVAAFTIERDTLEIHLSVVPSDSSVTTELVMAYATAHLPAPAVPVSVHVATGFPRTASGKIDRRQLAQQLVPSDTPPLEV